MVISENILLENGGEIIKYQSNDFLFKKNSFAEYYLQIKKGNVKISVTNFGKEFLCGLPYEGVCIAEAYMFINEKYPFNARAISDCEIIRLKKTKFHTLIKKHPSLLIDIYSHTAERAHYNNLMLPMLGILSPLEKIVILLDYIKNIYTFGDKKNFIIPYTRQQLASLIGLRLETVVRTIKKMERLKLLTILEGKIHY